MTSGYWSIKRNIWKGPTQKTISFMPAFLDALSSPIFEDTIFVLWRNDFFVTIFPEPSTSQITLFYVSTFAQYFKQYFEQPPVLVSNWIFCIDLHAAKVYPSTREIFISLVEFVGGIWHFGWKNGRLLLN